MLWLFGGRHPTYDGAEMSGFDLVHTVYDLLTNLCMEYPLGWTLL